jgi:hypothetical protein
MAGVWGAGVPAIEDGAVEGVVTGDAGGVVTSVPLDEVDRDAPDDDVEPPLWAMTCPELPGALVTVPGDPAPSVPCVPAAADRAAASWARMGDIKRPAAITGQPKRTRSIVHDPFPAVPRMQRATAEIVQRFGVLQPTA